LGIAEVFVAPAFDNVFRFDRGAGERFDAMMRDLATESGYAELADAPVVPIGHSACASYPWNFGAWNPRRTLAILSIKGDAPLTGLTGSGKPNPDWGARSIDGIPGLMVMSEHEWWDARLEPAMRFRHEHPGAPIALLADVGHGHFDALDPLVNFLALFVRKAAELRLPHENGGALVAVDPASGWLVDRWRGDEPLRAPAAPATNYAGPRAEAFWCADEEMARATEAFYVASRGKKRQQVDFVEAGEFAAISSSHAGVQLKPSFEADGVTFHLTADFIAPLPPAPRVAAKDQPPAVTVVTPTRAEPGSHADGPVGVVRITGPVAQIDASTFRIQFNRTASVPDRRQRDVWVLASHPGDDAYKGAVQQALITLPEISDGAVQRITFPMIPDQKAGTRELRLAASSDAGVPVKYYVREGPAEVDGDTLRFTELPPRTRFPVKVTVVAWQHGRVEAPKLKAAVPVTRTLLLTK
jgi:hypothetical protein